MRLHTWLSLLFVAASALIAGAILIVYGYTLGPLSKDSADWGSFGSILAGVFTLFGSAATIATLLFIQGQYRDSENKRIDREFKEAERQEKHDAVVRQQLTALTFEQYLNHRKLFFERLESLSLAYGRKFVFPNPEKVYNSIFSKNRPTYCSYKVDLEEAHYPLGLKDCLDIYESIRSGLLAHRSQDEMLQLLLRIARIQGALGMHNPNPPSEGDVLFFDKSVVVNIYDLSQDIFRIHTVLNSILFYSGNSLVEPIEHLGAVPCLRDSLYKTVKRYHRAKDGFTVFHELSFMSDLYDLYLLIDSRFRSKDLLNQSLASLSKLLSSTEEVRKMKDRKFAKQTIETIQIELLAAGIEMASDAAITKDLEETQRMLNAADSNMSAVFRL